MSEGAKVERTTSKRLFTLANKQFNLSINSNACVEIVKKRFGEVDQAWTSVMSKHASYLALQFPEGAEVSEVEENWIDDIAIEYNRNAMLTKRVNRQV